MNTIDAIIFDLDGTLIDTLQDIAYAMNRVLKQNGYPDMPVDNYRAYVGGGTREMVKAVVTRFHSNVDSEKMHDEFTHSYAANVMQYSKPYEDMSRILKELISDNLHIGVISNKTDALTKKLIEVCFPDVCFSFVKGLIEGVPKKPNPQVTQTSLKTINVKPHNAVFIGDTAIDVSTGRAAGMHTIGVTWGYRDKKELMDAGAHVIAHHPQDILSWLHQSR